jgi:hypothetical protein
MKRPLGFAATVLAAVFLAGCQTPLPPGAEPGPSGTMAYDVLVDASPPGAKIEANGAIMGNTPIHLKIFGDPDGTFHDFGDYYFTVRALPITTNQFVQARVFRTGHLLTPEDAVPKQIFFDMNQVTPAYPPGYVAPPAYYGPPLYYPGPYYYGPAYVRPGYRHYRRW